MSTGRVIKIEDVVNIEEGMGTAPPGSTKAKKPHHSTHNAAKKGPNAHSSEIVRLLIKALRAGEISREAAKVIILQASQMADGEKSNADWAEAVRLLAETAGEASTPKPANDRTPPNNNTDPTSGGSAAGRPNTSRTAGDDTGGAGAAGIDTVLVKQEAATLAFNLANLVQASQAVYAVFSTPQGIASLFLTAVLGFGTAFYSLNPSPKHVPTPQPQAVVTIPAPVPPAAPSNVTSIPYPELTRELANHPVMFGSDDTASGDVVFGDRLVTVGKLARLIRANQYLGVKFFVHGDAGGGSDKHAKNRARAVRQALIDCGLSSDLVKMGDDRATGNGETVVNLTPGVDGKEHLESH